MGIEVKFIPKGSSVYREDLKILISGCDEADNNVVNASMYECIGESCFPGTAQIVPVFSTSLAHTTHPNVIAATGKHPIWLVLCL